MTTMFLVVTTIADNPDIPAPEFVTSEQLQQCYSAVAGVALQQDFVSMILVVGLTRIEILAVADDKEEAETTITLPPDLEKSLRREWTERIDGLTARGTQPVEAEATFEAWLIDVLAARAYGTPTWGPLYPDVPRLA